MAFVKYPPSICAHNEVNSRLRRSGTGNGCFDGAVFRAGPFVWYLLADDAGAFACRCAETLGAMARTVIRCAIYVVGNREIIRVRIPTPVVFYHELLDTDIHVFRRVGPFLLLQLPQLTGYQRQGPPTRCNRPN